MSLSVLCGHRRDDPEGEWEGHVWAPVRVCAAAEDRSSHAQAVAESPGSSPPTPAEASSRAAAFTVRIYAEPVSGRAGGRRDVAPAGGSPEGGDARCPHPGQQPRSAALLREPSV
ncbi:hypothetical protein [Streptomyces sp. H021]|uniref:hypothetical protein n=1 Tax=Streptomyces sp. H021 TaxID=1519486 RepID=UPI003B634CCA